jgi:hypothetical protein
MAAGPVSERNQGKKKIFNFTTLEFLIYLYYWFTNRRDNLCRRFGRKGDGAFIMGAVCSRGPCSQRTHAKRSNHTTSSRLWLCGIS